MNQEFEWKNLPIIKITEKDKTLARMILSGTPQNSENKATRGFLFYKIVEGEQIMASEYDKFIKLGQAYLTTHWPSIKDWDAAVDGMTPEDLSWEPHLEAYVLFKKAEKRILKVQ